MSKFIKNIALFLAGLPLASGKALAVSPPTAAIDPTNDAKAVSLRPLNRDFDNLFAGHRSHSSHSSHASHASHSSHYSGSSGSYAAPSPPEPVSPPQNLAPALPFRADSPTPSASRPARSQTSAARPVGATRAAQGLSEPPLDRNEKLKLQVMRVQIKLTGLGLYSGRIDGELNAKTQLALRQFQTLKGLPETGLMSTPTLNALAIPAVN